ncbi:hypothetical protein F9B85_03995 [Heliorestis acidaminivorans]|uniref:SLH domain-containing protein n=1 Tax=Heliorestis acidaminivorans TaxID=553427 RepID=A0A6I0F531_9FIRM|nr:S-layer homology domain-containing protein [Heliorestis acidaminivorans]KAB2953787.1 hypothetical protein F9B85_03995 [Heliorestis acidaminivorans]
MFHFITSYRKALALSLALFFLFAFQLSIPITNKSKTLQNIANKALSVAEATYTYNVGTPTVTVTGPNVVRIEWFYSGDTVQEFRVLNLRGGTEQVLFTQAYTGTNKKYARVTTLGDNTYDIAIAAILPDNSQKRSGTKTVTISELAIPINFRGEAQGTREILWQWDSFAYGASGYKIYDHRGDLVGRVTDPNKTSFLETGLQPDTYYTRYVRAYKAGVSGNEYRESNRSNSAEVRTDYRDEGRSSGSTTDRSRIAEAIDNALNHSVSSSDVVVVRRSDADDRWNFNIRTNINRYVAFTYDALQGYDDGSVRVSTTDIELQIPARWLRRGDSSGGTVVALREYIDNTSAPAGKARIGTAYELDLIRYSDYSRNGYTVNSFSSDDPVHITFYYDYWHVSNPASLKIYKQEGNTWRELPSTVNTANRSVHSRVTSFGRFALFETPTGNPALYPGSSLTPGSGSYGYPGFAPHTPTPAGYPPGFGPGYGAGYNDPNYQYNPANYGSYYGYHQGFSPGAPQAYYPGGPSYSGNPYAGAAQAPFIDTVGHWARPQIEALAFRGLVNGTAPRIFEPDKKTTRAEFITLLANSLNLGGGYSMPGAPPFRDVRADEWYAGPLQRALQAGIVTEQGPNFRPHEAITRQEMAAWAGRAVVGRINFANQSSTITPEYLNDWNQVRSDLRPDIANAIRAGLIQGRPNNTFDPHNHTTRAEASVIILNYIEKIR